MTSLFPSDCIKICITIAVWGRPTGEVGNRRAPASGNLLKLKSAFCHLLEQQYRITPGIPKTPRPILEAYPQGRIEVQNLLHAREHFRLPTLPLDFDEIYGAGGNNSIGGVCPHTDVPLDRWLRDAGKTIVAGVEQRTG